MVNGSVEIGLVPREFIMSDCALCLIGDDYGAQPVLWQLVHVVTRAQAKVQAAETSQAGDIIERVESRSNRAVNETNVSYVAFTVKTTVNSNKHSSVGFDNVSQSFINRAELAKMQQDNTTLKDLFDIAHSNNNNEETAEGNSQYIIHTNGLLIRQFHDSLSSPDSDNIDSITQNSAFVYSKGSNTKFSSFSSS